jgi:putative endonuclease
MPLNPSVYMLRCRGGTYYVGLSQVDLEKRVAEHQAGKYDGWTKSRRPVALVWSEHFQWLTDAIVVERRLKGWTRAKKEALIRGDWHAIRELAQCRNATASHRRAAARG